TVKVRVALDSKDPRIVPDMGVRVSFLEKPRPATGNGENQGVRVPAAAIVERGGASVVFVVGADDTVERRSLTLGRALAADRQVLKGLVAGETVVLDPPAELENGAKVKLTEEAAGE
ncbi:MAG TPA: efflux RND transporter periplasmic adaptor subunit, partial [Pseudoxanthomonas sp.]|nr:efflux RND transporter periplasmic adaptor subunit [Pseudoxanthomonas sp.]